MGMSRCLWLAAGVLFAAAAIAQDTSHGVKPDATVTAPALSVPYSDFASPEGRALFVKLAHAPPPPPLDGPIEKNRVYYDRLNSDRVARMRKLYAVRIQGERIGGVGAEVVLPAQGVASENEHRVLINLHGGAFLWGAHSGGLVEAIPLASIGRIKVITVDYRQGPEFRFPAASADVEAVYRELLKHYQPGQIGIYGCSAGGILTAESVARLISDKLPVPGAIGTFCASLLDIDGDTAYVGPLLNGQGVPAHRLTLTDLPYFKGADPRNPLVQPGLAPALLARFPPTLLITGSRDMAMSSVLASQQLLDKAGVQTELHAWEGMWHSFFSDPELPESQDAYRVMARFFHNHLSH